MKSKRIFIISCYFDGSNNAILDCVASIKKYYLNPKIVVIDSNSPNKTYFNKLRKDNVIVLNSKNKNYDTGAYWIGFKKFSNYEYFYFLQDSVKFKANLSKFEQNTLNTFRYFLSASIVGGVSFNKTKKIISKKVTDIFKKDKKIHDLYGFNNINEIKWTKGQLKKTKFFLPLTWVSVFGPIFMCKKIIMTKLKKKNFHKILPTNKEQQMCMERLFGIAFQQEGYDCTQSIQGDNFKKPYKTSNFEKIFLKRK